MMQNVFSCFSVYRPERKIPDWLVDLICVTDVGSGAQDLTGEIGKRKLGLHADKRK